MGTSNQHATYRLLYTAAGTFAMISNTDGHLTATTWVETSSASDFESMKHDPTLLDAVADRLARYFEGEAVDFSDIPTPASTPFRQRCLDACRSIPRGQTRSYAELAKTAGANSGAARAAGQAMRTNPLPVIIPCHRVIASDGSLGGFAGSSDINGTELGQKRFLLELEHSSATTLTRH